MRMKITVSFAAIGLMFLMAKTMTAHHSFDAEYDSKKTATITGYVTKLDWVNPHAWIYLDVLGEKGALTHWGSELGSPNILLRNGWSRCGGKPALKLERLCR